MKLKRTKINKHLVKVSIGCELDQHTGTICGELEIDLEYASKFNSEFMALIQEYDQQIILCFENVPYIDSEGLWAVFDIYRKLADQGKTLVISNPNENVKRVFKIIKLDSKIKIFNTEEQAIKNFEGLKNF